MKLIVWCLCVCLLFFSCKKFVFHPNEVRPDVHNVNIANVEKISQLTAKSSFKFIMIGDTQRFYQDLDAFVDNVNGLTDISFVVIDGDLTDFGLNREYNWIINRLQQLKNPFISIIGNHDMLANGRQIYGEMFGPENFTFTFSGSKFVCLNTNSREVNFDGSVPDMNWLTSSLASDEGAQNIFVIAHVAPFSLDFDKSIEPAYTALLSSTPKVRLSMNAHEHHYSLTQPYNDGLEYLVAASTDQREYSLITVNGANYQIEQKKF